MTAQHSPIAPSSAARRVQCPASTRMEAVFPEVEDTPEAAEGTAAHWAVAEVLAGRLIDIGQIAPNGVVLDQAMCEAADLMYDDIARELAPWGVRPEQGQIEQPVAIPRIHAQSWGTPDYRILLPGILFLYDFKYGHRFVEVFENLQLVEYIAGSTQGQPDTLQIVAKIVQPRSFHKDGPIRTWKTTLGALRALINVCSNAAHEALSTVQEPRMVTGAECRDCKARHACPALQAQGYAAVAVSRQVTPLVLEPAAAALELRTLREARALLEARESGLEEQIKALLKQGKPVPGWALTRGEGRMKWKAPAAQVIAIGKAMNLDLSKPQEVITPTQALDRGLDPAIVAAMAERPPGAATLEPVDSDQIRKVFS